MKDYYSHPGKVFINHIREIIEIGEKLIDMFGPEKNESKEFYKKILRYFAFFHDLGKLTKDNQEKIKRGEKLQHPHSIYGGIIFRIFCLEKLNLEFSKNLNDKEKRIIYFIIRHHHSDLSNFWEIDKSIENKNYKKEYVEEILSSLADFSSLFYSLFSIQIDRILSSIRNNDLSELLEEIKKEEEAINFTRLKNNSTIDDYIDILFISSICFLSDRLSANNSGEIFLKEIDEEINIKKYEELEEKIITHISSLHSSDKIDKIRMECHNEIIQRFKNIDIQTARIFNVSLPTGIGKTYIGIRIAISIAKRYNTPIIYSLPFINIIEQIDINFRKIFGNENVEKFHYLSVINTENLEEERIDEFINFKVSPILITTFFQIFTTLFPNSRTSILKFPILVNSCLILDELQSFNPEFYYIFERLIEKIIEKGFRLRLILMSATLPPLFEGPNDLIINLTTTELREKYYNLFNRYKILFKGEVELEEYKKYLLDKITSSDKERIGIICNKVEEAREIFNFLKEKLNCKQKKYLES
ncbi:MAG: CRISPR-associated endonuclease Cas3'', partial [Candidatus Aenigmatarchaeota archaeon]